MNLKTWVMATILFSGAFALFVLIATDAVGNYPDSDIINPDIEQRYNQLDNSSRLVGSLTTAVKDEGGLSLIGGVQALFSATIGVVNLVLNSLTLLPIITANFAEDFGIPSPVTYLFFTIAILLITVAVVFAILNAGSGGRV